MPSIALYRSADLRWIEAAAGDQPLMQRAGRAAADLAARICADSGATIVIFAGPGNNGGDAFEAARLLRERFFDVQVIFVGCADALPRDAAAAYRRFITAGGSTQVVADAGSRCALVIDGLFGIGLKREIGEPYAALIESANALALHNRCPLLALDCPSGLDADTGRRSGATIAASHTITLIGAKPGLYTADGPDCCGDVSIAALELEADKIVVAPGRTIAPDLFAEHLKPRALNSHKGNFGDAGIVGGAAGMVGAALLAARAALKLGSGRVYVGLVDDSAPALDPVQPELMLRAGDSLLSTELTALACGPGLGKSDAARALLESACKLTLPLVVDADALNLIAADSELQALLASRASRATGSAPSLLTPHPAEAARLLACDVATVQADRLGAALELATRFNACVALKGRGTIVADANGKWYVNMSGNPGLATAGSGDVLTGFVTALLAQGWPALEALLAAVHLHGVAADDLVALGCGPVGLTAGELIASARHAFNAWLALHAV